MPANTITEFRDKNPRGRDKRKNTKRCLSPTNKNFKKGNTTSIKGFCSHCNPTLANSINKKNQLINTIKNNEFNLTWRVYIKSQSDNFTEGVFKNPIRGKFSFAVYKNKS